MMASEQASVDITTLREIAKLRRQQEAELAQIKVQLMQKNENEAKRLREEVDVRTKMESAAMSTEHMEKMAQERVGNRKKKWH